MPKHHHIFSSAVALILLACLLSAIAALAEPPTKQFIRLLPKQDEHTRNEDLPLQLSMKEDNKGIRLVITFLGDKISLEKGAQPAPPGGIYTVSLDGSMVLQESFSEPTLHTEKQLPLHTLANGEHVVRCELLYSMGKTYQAKLSFAFDATPIITVEEEDPASASPDPSVSFQFFTDNQDIVGFVDIAVDEQSLGTTEITAQTNGKEKKLSQWMGKTIGVAELPLGQHLISLTAKGTNGVESVQFIPFQVQALPMLDVDKNSEGVMESLKAIFLQASNVYSGSVDIFYQHVVILSLQSKEPTVLITKSDIMQAFARHELPLPTKPETLVVALRSANTGVHWQTILFQP